MINFKYTKPDSQNTNGGIRIDIENTPFEIEFPWKLPLSFFVINSISNEILWESLNMYPGHWSYFPWGFESIAIVKDSDDQIVFRWEWNALIDGDESHKFFHSWALSNKGSKGISIGTHDGTSGEWVGPVRNGYLEAFLVEASTKQYLKLVKNYNGIKSYPILALVTANGGQVEFFEGGLGHTNSVSLKHVLEYHNEGEITKKLINSISLNDLIINLGLSNNLGWLHLDVEGLDVDLVMSLDDSIIKLPDVIIFETLNIDDDKKNSVLEWLTIKNYQFKISGWNTIALKNKL